MVMIRRSNLAAIAAVTVGGCAPVLSVPSQVPPAIEIYKPGEIIVSTIARGILRSENGCLIFSQPGGSQAAQFPAGTTYSSGAVRLPNGQNIPLGRPVTLVFEASPGASSSLPGCSGMRSIQVIRRKA